MSAALADAGVPAAAIAAHLARLPLAAAELVELDADDEGLSAGLFVALGHSWHRAPAVAVPGVGLVGGQRTGLILSEIAAAAALTGIAVSPERFADLRAMEAAAVAVWAKAK